jgi:hypothetical protein
VSGFGYLVGGLERIELGLGYGNILLHLGSLDLIRDRLGLVFQVLDLPFERGLLGCIARGVERGIPGRL